jgi:Raf kinase inhibitor-like YbhB/YbcL family protein
MMIAAAAFALASLTFRSNATLPQTTVYDRCGGPNISPELHWTNAPRGTRSFALTLFDPDATGGWYHWVAYNIPASTTRFSPGVRLPIGELGATSFKQLGYGGPCPPPGKVHHYIFTLYALNVRKVGPAGMTGPRLEIALRRHTLGRTSITGLYSR